ncbi:MAG: hypothetical protein J6A19_00865, partial [Oscillospiraceae bacterium]|nr:hypothetical protein [Oscillospiraceae bacterium]
TREWWGFAPHPTSFCAKRKRKAFSALRAEVAGGRTRPTNSNLPHAPLIIYMCIVIIAIFACKYLFTITIEIIYKKGIQY